MKLLAQTAQAAPLPAPTQSTIADVSYISLIIAAGAFVLRQGWDWFRSKDQQESDLTKMLIEDLRANKQQLLDGNREGFQEIVKAIGDLKAATTEMTKTIHDDVQVTLRSQTTLYTSHLESLGEIKQSLQALHRRYDELIVLLRAGCNVEPAERQ